MSGEEDLATKEQKKSEAEKSKQTADKSKQTADKSNKTPKRRVSEPFGKIKPHIFVMPPNTDPPKNQKSDVLSKTPKEKKISKVEPKTEPPKRITRGRPAVAKLNESFDETKIRKTVKDDKVNIFCKARIT